MTKPITATEIVSLQTKGAKQVRGAIGALVRDLEKKIFQWVEDELQPLPYHPKREIVYTTYKARMCKDFLSCGKTCYYSSPKSTYSRWVECQYSAIPSKRMELLEIDLPLDDKDPFVPEEYGAGAVHYTQIKKLKDVNTKRSAGEGKEAKTGD